jgi:hydrogenase-4 membrane subunit HyfE
VGAESGALGGPGIDLRATLDGLALALMALAMWMMILRRIDVAIVAVAGQAGLLTAAALVVAAAEPAHAGHAVAAAALTGAVKVGIIPFILLLVLTRVTVRREADPVLPTKLTVAIAAGLVLVAYRAAGTLGLPFGAGGAAAPNVLPAALALMLLGLFLMVTRRAALMQVLGLITAENGMYLLALVATAGLPLAVELAVLADVLVGAILLGVLSYRIGRTFDHIDTDALRKLRF